MNMEISRDNVFEIIEKAGLKADKDYGQNYLAEPVIAKRITDLLEVRQEDDVLEIGPGLGSLTHFISGYHTLTLVDIDERMIAFLKVIYQNSPIQFIREDIRKVDVSSYHKIIGNLPYNITTELVTYLLLNATKAEKMVLMCQLEAFSRFADLSGENYGPVSVLLHLLGTIHKEFSVKAGSFIPAPKITSVVFSFQRTDEVDLSTAVGVYRLAKQLFVSRRKTIGNNLKTVLPNKTEVDQVLNQLGISPLARPEEIPVSQYLAMYQIIRGQK